MDNLVNSSNAIADTLDRAIKRVGGVQSHVPGGSVTPNGYLEVEAVMLTEAQKNAYNTDVLAVQADIFSKTAQEYFTEQYAVSQEAFSQSVDQFIAAITPLAVAAHVADMAAQVQLSGDAIQGQQLQQYVTANNVMITTEGMTMYNDSLTMLQDATDQFSAVAAVYNDQQMIDNFQFNADANGVDFLNADNVFLDRIENQAFTGYDAAVVVDFTTIAGVLLVQDISTNIETTTFLNQAGVASTFYTTGPTQDDAFLCSFVDQAGYWPYQNEDPSMPCFLSPTP